MLRRSQTTSSHIRVISKNSSSASFSRFVSCTTRAPRNARKRAATRLGSAPTAGQSTQGILYIRGTGGHEIFLRLAPNATAVRVRFAIFVRNRHFYNDFKLLDERTMPAGHPIGESRDALDPAPWPGRLRSPLPNGSAAPAPDVLGAGRGHADSLEDCVMVEIKRLPDTWLLRGAARVPRARRRRPRGGRRGDRSAAGAAPAVRRPGVTGSAGSDSNITLQGLADRRGGAWSQRTATSGIHARSPQTSNAAWSKRSPAGGPSRGRRGGR